MHIQCQVLSPNTPDRFGVDIGWIKRHNCQILSNVPLKKVATIQSCIQCLRYPKSSLVSPFHNCFFHVFSIQHDHFFKKTWVLSLKTTDLRLLWNWAGLHGHLRNADAFLHLLHILTDDPWTIQSRETEIKYKWSAFFLRISTCIYMHVTCIHVCMYACMHVCMYACMHVCMYACMHVCMYVSMCVYVCICVELCMCVCVVCVCVCICMCIRIRIRMHKSIHIYIYTT